jgi:hypothetical protein
MQAITDKDLERVTGGHSPSGDFGSHWSFGEQNNSRYAPPAASVDTIGSAMRERFGLPPFR